MVSMKKKTKILIVFLILILSTLILAKSSKAAVEIKGANDNIINLDTTTTFYLSGRVLKDNNNVYCVEQGKQFDNFKNMQYWRSEKHSVQDPMLNYILNMPDESKDVSNYRKINLKQNLIWRYMGPANINNSDTQFIRGRGNDHTTQWPASYTMSWGDTDGAWETAEKYATSKNNYGIKIDEMYLDTNGNNVVLKVSGTFDSYDVYANGNFVGNYGNEDTYKSIPIEKFGNDATSATVEVKAKQIVYHSSIYVLFRNQSQKFIAIDPTGKETETSKSAKRTIPLNVDVSLQKYISEVNGKKLYDIYTDGDKYIVSGKAEEMLNRWNTVAENQYNKGNYNKIYNNGKDIIVAKPYDNQQYYKINNSVNIEAGDVVTYEVYVYNNDSNRTAKNIKVTDQLSYTNGNKIEFNGNKATLVNFKFEVQKGNSSNVRNVGYKIQEGNIVINPFDLAGGENAKITVQIKFNTQETEQIRNYAKITSDNNKENYRIEDADYINMRKYEVSLEKYISNVTSNTVSTIDLSGYGTILSYLREHSTITLDDLIKKNKKIDSNYEDYDLNKDGKVDIQDVNIYNSIKGSNIEDIKKYIECDLNSDGIINDQDLNIYKIIKANLNKDTWLNQYDKYMYVAKILYDKNYLSSENNQNMIFGYLRVYSRLLELNKNDFNEMKADIENYIKSDVNEDGYVTLEDEYVLDQYIIDGTKLKDLEKYNLEDIKKINEKIEKYDINEDGLLDQNDIALITAYYNKSNGNSRYNIIGKIDEQLLESFTDEFNKKYSIILDEKSSEDLHDCDVNIDGKIDWEDYHFLGDSEENLKKYIANLLNQLNSDNNTAYDLNKNNSIDYEDYLILKEYNKLVNGNITEKIETIANYIESHDIAKTQETGEGYSLNKDDVNILKIKNKIKEYNGAYNNPTLHYLYDLTMDGIINQEDIDYLTQYGNNKDLYEDIKNILDAENIEQFDAFLKENISNELLRDMNIDFQDIDNNKSNSEILNDILKDTILLSQAEEILEKSEEYTKITGISYKDILARVGIDISNLNTNNDEMIDINDIEALGDISKEKIQKIKDIETKYKENDLDEDDDWDQNDINLSAEIEKVNNAEDKENIKNAIIKQIDGDSINDSLKNRPGKAEHKYDNDTSTNDTWKHNNVVANVEKWNIVTYTIKVTNDSKDTRVYITQITDYLPDGIKYGQVEYNGGQYDTRTNNAVEFTELKGILLAPGESASFTVDVQVIEPNMSVEIMKNTATITQMKNKNGVTVEDSTPFNNTDSDYFQMKDITIQGTVWNDIALDKGQHNYDGIYDEKQEKKLPDIKVMLYRQGVNDPIATTTTDANGRYVFSLDYIKGPKVSDTNRWAGTYYSYYVVFEYDGITYTSSLWNDVTSNNKNDSNAREDGAKVKETRAKFNARFSTINNESGIEYTTINEKERAPQSKHKYDPRTMAMQSSTNLISLSKTAALEEQLQHVNLGLRGKDIFDLELKSDVYSTKVTVNNQSGVYNYGDNHVTIRREDVSNKDYEEDMAHVNSQVSEYKGEQYEQGVRKTDIDVKEAGANVTPYETTGLGIEVTYKITVTNKSLTDGTATKITNYFDSKYNFERAYDSNGNTLSTNAGTSGTGYNSVIITTPRTNLSQGEPMEIYVVYTLKDAAKTLEGLVKDEVLPTYNMAEIEEYKTKCAEGQTEYTRGLLDKNSAPGSANKEQARLKVTEGQSTTTENGNPTTVEYYFAARELDKLKYEDDTYSTPTLYFVAPKEDQNNPDDNGYTRTIIGTVFEDITTTNPTTKVKTGNGKLDRGEVGVYGATVTLIELKSDNREVARYRTTTDENGKFKFSGFLPGDYIIKYEYGDTNGTVLKNQSAKDGINNESFNGEDYQSTNNAYPIDGMDTNVLQYANLNDENKAFWYVYNEKEGISTATDNSDRRSDVSKMVTLFTDEEMTVLNNMRDGKNEEQSKVTYQKDGRTETVTVNNIIDKTKMDAWTAPMKFLVEKKENLGDRLVQKSAFGEYVISNMNFGIAEVPVTEINLQKHVQSFRIVDSTGKNVIASMEKDKNGNWKTQGNVLAETFDVSIEDEKLQGAKLTVTYEITSEMTTEKNFDNKELTVPTITGIVDYIDNNLSYNPALGDNDKYWELTTHNDTKAKYEESQFKGGTKPIGTVDPEGIVHTTIVKAKDGNPILLNEAGKGSATITLEKVLSATDVTIDQIVTSTAETFAYANTVEITGLDYKNVTSPDKEAEPQRDRIRTSNRYIILPGVQHDSATSEEIVIHPPTGDSSINIIYFVIAVISLVILAGGTFGIKKFVLDNKKK